MMIIDEPDLILAQGENSIIGYVKKVEMDVPKPKTPEEAVKLNNPPPEKLHCMILMKRLLLVRFG